MNIKATDNRKYWFSEHKQYYKQLVTWTDNYGVALSHITIDDDRSIYKELHVLKVRATSILINYLDHIIENGDNFDEALYESRYKELEDIRTDMTHNALMFSVSYIGCSGKSKYMKDLDNASSILYKINDSLDDMSQMMNKLEHYEEILIKK